MSPDRERALVARARRDGAAFGELYDFYLPRIHGFIARRVGERSVSEDLTATTFERALEAVRRDDFRNDSFGGWLYRVAANAVVDHARRRRRLVPLGDGADPGERDGHGPLAADPPDTAADAFAAALERDELRRALVRLPEAHRRVLVLRFFDDLDVDELCGVLGCSRRTFAVKLHRALRALRGALMQETTDAA
ncbi:MAG: hypothetical protein A2X23_01500 [Chloroflexi bacterium GWC2_73_18]|nr:MAG: hypothetical protein A2X23_01500 [Chloroflexi bacterium GWC2_73_18]